MATSLPSGGDPASGPAGTTADARALRPAEPGAEDPTIGRLLADASRDVSSLVRNEIALAKSELKVSVKIGGMAVGLFAGAAFLGLLAVIMLSVAFAYFLHMAGLHLAWSFLIVFAAYVLLAGVLGLVGVKKVRKVRGPERAIHQAQETKTIFSRN
jgi:hypothetical protein